MKKLNNTKFTLFFLLAIITMNGLMGCAPQTGNSASRTDENQTEETSGCISEMPNAETSGSETPLITEAPEELDIPSETSAPGVSEMQDEDTVGEPVELLVTTPIPIQYPLPSTTPIPLDEYPAGIIKARDNASEGEYESEGGLWDLYFDTWMESGCVRDFDIPNYSVCSHHITETREACYENGYSNVGWDYELEVWIPQIYYTQSYIFDVYGDDYIRGSWDIYEIENEINQGLYNKMSYSADDRSSIRNTGNVYSDYSITLAEEHFLSIRYFCYSIGFNNYYISLKGITLNPITGEIYKLSDFIILDDTLLERVKNGEIHYQQEFISEDGVLSMLERFIRNYSENLTYLKHCFYIDADTLYLLIDDEYYDTYITLEIPLGT